MKKFLMVILVCLMWTTMFSDEVNPIQPEYSLKNGILIFKVSVEKEYRSGGVTWSTYNDRLEFPIRRNTSLLDVAKDSNRKIIVIHSHGNFTDSGSGGRWILTNLSGKLIYRPAQKSWFVEITYTVQLHGITAVINKIDFMGISI